MFTVVLRCADHRQQPGAGHLVALHHQLQLDHLGSPVGDGPGLIEHHRLDLRKPTEKKPEY